MTNNSVHVCVKELRKTYQTRRDDIEAIRLVDMEITEVEFVSILGPSGCGKSTLLMIVGGLLPITSGRVEIGSERVSGPRRDTGVVFQAPVLMPWRSIVKNVMFPIESLGLSQLEYRERANELLEMTGLTGFRENYPSELSGGMQQRVALARCLANDPDVILMDEPLGALDALTREKMQGLVLKLWKETGKTIMLITHSVEEAVLLGERLLVLAPRPGRILKEYKLPYAEMGSGMDLREVKKSEGYIETRDEILSIIWEMEEEIMGRVEND